jgi:chromosome partitioning protein
MWQVRRMAHRVLTVCGLKGGIGKSAVATNLAAWWSAAGQRVLLIDADPNGSATKLHARGEGALLAAGSAVAPIQQAPMAMAKPWDLVVVDTAGGSRDEQRTYAEGSDFVLAPCQPAASSIEQVMDLAEILKATGVPFGVVLTMADTRRKVDAIKTRQVLERVGLPVLRLRSRCCRHGRKPKPLALPCAMHAPTPTGQTPVPLRHGSRWQTLPPKSKPS